MNPVLISYENETGHEKSEFFFDTARRNGWEVQQVGLGEKWEGFFSKVKRYRDVCATYNKDRILVLSDARDVFCVRDSKAFTAAFEYFSSPILVSAELFCEGRYSVEDNFVGSQSASLTSYFKHHNLLPGLRKFVNSGLIAGRASALHEMWSWIIENNYKDDQLGIAMYMNAFPQKVALDVDAIVLHSSTYGVEGGIYHIHQQKQDSPTFAELFGCGAFFLHIPGLRLKGQQFIYDCVRRHLENHPSNEIVLFYGKPEPAWDEFKDLKPLH
jgi:hypothetical protein